MWNKGNDGGTEKHNAQTNRKHRDADFNDRLMRQDDKHLGGLRLEAGKTGADKEENTGECRKHKNIKKITEQNTDFRN